MLLLIILWQPVQDIINTFRTLFCHNEQLCPHFHLTFHSILLSLHVLSLTTSFSFGSFLRLRKDGSLSFLFTHSVCLWVNAWACLHLYFVRHGQELYRRGSRTTVGTIFDSRVNPSLQEIPILTVRHNNLHVLF